MATLLRDQIEWKTKSVWKVDKKQEAEQSGTQTRRLGKRVGKYEENIKKNIGEHRKTRRGRPH